MDKRLTWNEFKEAVDAALAKDGIDGDVEVHCIESYKPKHPIVVSLSAVEEDRVPRLYVE